MKKLAKTAIKLSIAVSAAGAGVLAVKKRLATPEGQRAKNDAVDTLAHKLCKGIAAIIPNGTRPFAYEYDNSGFMPGHTEFLDAPAEGAKWRLGYADASLLPDDICIGKYYMAGYLHFPPNVITDVIDDQMFRCVCVDDSSGRGAAVWGVIDCVGMSGNDIRQIRLMLEDYAKEHNIVSINISSTHSHSEIDTQGLWGDLPEALKTNPLKILKNEDGFVSGRNAEYMEALKQRAVLAVKRAYEGMKEGKLYVSVLDGSRFVRDKREPNVLETDITNLIFKPDDGSKPTRAVFMAAHPTQMGYNNTVLSADYPYYICQALQERSENALFFQGPQAAVATNRGGNIPEGLDTVAAIQAYGRAIGDFCFDNAEASIKEIEPLLNVRIRETFLCADNSLFLLIGKLRLVSNTIIRTGDKVTDAKFATEIGYAELGNQLKLAMFPGELMPELLLGGCFTADKSYHATEWNYRPIKDMIKGDGKTVGIGLCNDAIGYIVPDNDFGSIIAPDHYEEAVSVGGHTASKLVSEFENMLGVLGRLK